VTSPGQGASAAAGRTPIRCVLVGCGRISDKHFDAIASHPELELTAVCDIVEERARAASARYDVPAFTEYETMLDAVEADVAVICSPRPTRW
jgi:predicted dehydrogenase